MCQLTRRPSVLFFCASKKSRYRSKSLKAIDNHNKYLAGARTCRK